MWGCVIVCENLWWLWARQEQPILTLSANFARRGDSLLAVGQGCYLHPFVACSAAGEQRNILSPRQVPPAAVALRNAPAGAALCAPAVFASRFARLRGIACWWWGRVATSTHSPPVRRRVNRGTSSLCAPAVFASRFARLRGIACWWWGRVATSTHSPPVRRRGNRGTSSLIAPAVFAPRFARLRGDSRAGKKITFPQKRKSQKEAPDTAWGRNTAPWVLSQQDKPSRMDTMAQFTLSHIILIIVPCRDNGVNTTRNVAPRGIFCIFVPTFGQYVKTACKLLFSQRNISCRPSIFAAAIAALPLFYQSKTAAPPLWERPPLQTIRCHAFSFIFAEQSLHSAQHIVLLSISANLLVDIIVQFFYCVSPLCIIHVDLFPWPRWF